MEKEEQLAQGKKDKLEVEKKARVTNLEEKTERLDRERYEDKRREREEQTETRRYNKTIDMAEERT